MRQTIVIVFISISSFCYSQQYSGTRQQGNIPDERAASCAPANASAFLEFNNVKALIYSGKNL